MSYTWNPRLLGCDIVYPGTRVPTYVSGEPTTFLIRARVTEDQDSTLHGVTSVKQTFTGTLTAHTWTKLLSEYGWNNWLQLQPQVCRSCRYVTEHLLYSLRGKDNPNLIRGISGYVRHLTTTTTTTTITTTITTTTTTTTTTITTSTAKSTIIIIIIIIIC